jgi:hypothetical protein
MMVTRSKQTRLPFELFPKPVSACRLLDETRGLMMPMEEEDRCRGRSDGTPNQRESVHARR